MTPRINALTAEQSALLPQVRDEWLAVGLSTQPADRPTAEAGVRAAYQAAKLTPPRAIVWLDSPWAGALGQAIAPPMVAMALSKRGQVRGQVGDQVWGQVWDQVGDQVGDQVWGQVGDQVWGQVWDQVRDQVRDQVWGQVRGQVWDQVRDQVRDQVWGQVRDQVWGQVRGQVWDQVWGQVRGQVRGQVWGQVRGQVRGQVWGQVGDQVWGQVRNWHVPLLYGAFEAGYYGWADAMERIGVIGIDLIHGQQQVARSSGMWWCYRDVAVLTERPQVLLRDDQFRLHAADGPALRWPDGWALHRWHGTPVPADLVSGDGWDLPRILSEQNTELRRCAIERLGWDVLVERAQLRAVHTAPDPGNPGADVALYDLPGELQPYEDPIRLLLVRNGTPERDGTVRRYGLSVPSDMSDAVTAAAWTYGTDRKTYAALARRT